MNRTYWRIQQAGQALSRSHRSTIGFEEDDLGSERATSATESFSDLVAWARGGHANWIGPVDIICFIGEFVGRGSDGEPVVVPLREKARWRIVGGSAPGWLVSEQLRGARTISDVVAEKVAVEEVLP